MPNLSIATEPGDFASAGGITGGSGGKSIVVTNLNDSSSGSLRNALNTPGPRIITFTPGLTGTLKISNTHIDVPYGDFTLDGAGAKITISGHSIYLSSSADARSLQAA